MLAQATHEAPILRNANARRRVSTAVHLHFYGGASQAQGGGAHGQQPVWPLMRCAPQQIPGEVCEKARRQSFLKQQSLQPCEARLRWLDAATAVVGSAATTASMRSWMIAFIAKLL